MSSSLFQIGPYEVIAELARDALGVTYACRQGTELFAVTHIDESLARDSQFCEAFERALPGLALEDPQLAHATAGRFAYGRYLVSPYVESVSLAELLAITPSCEPAILARILKDVLAGLTAAHARGHLHLHLSPARISVGRDGVSRICELGLAAARGFASPGLTPYTAPRVAGEAFDARADVFSIGAIAWSALTGQALFAGRDEAGTRERLLSLPVPPPSEVGKHPPAAWDAAILRALARDPSERYGSIRELAEAIAATGEPATWAEVELWVGSTCGPVFARRRAAVIASDPTEVVECRASDAPVVPAVRRPTRHVRALGLLAVAMATGMLVASLVP